MLKNMKEHVHNVIAHIKRRAARLSATVAENRAARRSQSLGLLQFVGDSLQLSVYVSRLVWARLNTRLHKLKIDVKDYSASDHASNAKAMGHSNSAFRLFFAATSCVN